ncbi:MAG: polysaccharide biosynthesis tyrosine autokinase [Burkholderiales bacterium]|nr:polysaccharide biosynthesis tyrosine autokinase [Burkholderiales bacterium]
MNDLTFNERFGTPTTLQPEPQEEPLDLLEYWRSITKRKWGILGLVALVAVLTTLVVYAMRPTYRATTTVLIEQGKNKVVSIEEVYNNMGAGSQREYFQTQVEILKSREIAERVVKRLNLTKHPDFDPSLDANRSLYSRHVAPLFTEASAPSEDQILKSVVDSFRQDLQVQPVRNSQLTQIHFVAHDKELAAKVTNTLAEVYIESDLEAKLAMTQKASSWLTERLGELRKKLDESERALQDYRDRERIVDAKGVALSGASRQLDELTRSLVESRQKRAEAEAAFNQVQAIRQGKSQAGYESVPAVLRHPLVQKLKEQEAEAERKLGDASKRYGAEHPRMIQASSELASAKENTRRQIEVVVAGISKEYEVARANEQAVANALAQSKGDIQSLNRKEFQLGVLEREAQQNRQLYDMFVARFKETNVAGDLQSTVARVIDAAVVPNLPFAPRKAQIVTIAAALALVLAVMMALLLDRLNNTVNTTFEVERRLGLPLLGYLQKLPGGEKKGFHSELAFFNDSQSLFAESIRTVRTGLLMTALDTPQKVVVVTSSVPGEGKTTISFNLACAMAQVKKTLLIDADMRRPKVGKLLGRDGGAPGLSALVAGTAQASQCIFHDAKSGAYFMTAGAVPPNPLELLTSKRFIEVLEKLRETFEIIIIDSPPLQMVSDSLVLAQHATSMVYVVRADSTPHQVARGCIKRLRMIDAPLAGVVLNQLDLEKASRYYGEYGGYGYKKYKGATYGYAYGREPDDAKKG